MLKASYFFPLRDILHTHDFFSSLAIVARIATDVPPLLKNTCSFRQLPS